VDASNGSTLETKPLTAPGAVPLDVWMTDHQMSLDGNALVAMGKSGLIQWDLRSGAFQEIQLPDPNKNPNVQYLALASTERETLAVAEFNRLLLREPPIVGGERFRD